MIADGAARKDRRRSPAIALGELGASLGLLAGLAELSLGPSIRSWVGDKEDTTRLGLATILLAGLALAAALALRRPTLHPPQRLAAAVTMLAPGLICFTTVGRLWYVPGTLLVAGGLAALVSLRGDVRDVIDALDRGWPAVLTAVLALLYVFLGATALGLAGVLGMAGGLVVLAVVGLRRHLSPAVALLLVAIAALPFALLTWWSIVSPLIAVLLFAHAIAALRPAGRVGRGGVAMPRGGGLR